MVSTITDRIGGVASGIPVAQGLGMVLVEGVTGTNTVTGTTFPAIDGYTVGMIYSIRPVNANTGPVDVNFGSGGLVNLLKPNGDELAAGEFDPALNYLVQFNGTEMRIVTPSF